MVLNFVVMIIVSNITKPPPQDVQDLVGSLRYPKESTNV
jgi:cation/acetate symporter